MNPNIMRTAGPCFRAFDEDTYTGEPEDVVVGCSPQEALDELCIHLGEPFLDAKDYEIT